jgi:hypothetical protein
MIGRRPPGGRRPIAFRCPLTGLAEAHWNLVAGVLLIMAGGGYVQLPDGSVIVALTLPVPAEGRRPSRSVPAPARRPGRSRGGAFDGLLPSPRRWSAHADEPHAVRPAVPAARHGEEPRVRVLVHALNRPRALTRLRNLGLRAVYLRGNAQPPTADEINAVLHHPDGLVWRLTPGDARDSWRPIASLLRPHGRVYSA